MFKEAKVAQYYQKPFNELLKEWYLKNYLSGNAIAIIIQNEVGVRITPRHIQRRVQELRISRTKSAARHAGIKNGRIDYSKLRKPIKSVELRRGISLSTRYAILKRDNFRCVLCGITAKKTQLVIDHIVPVVSRGTNTMRNLRTVCKACNHGKMIYEQEK